MSDKVTREPQYQICLDIAKHHRSQFGLMSNQVWRDDPRRLGFLLARYKFVAKMMSGLSRVLEVGCADGFGTRVVRQEVEQVVATDFDPVFIEDDLEIADESWPIDFRVHDMLTGPVAGGFDGAYSLDVIEHIRAEDESLFIGNMVDSLSNHGVCMIGTPSLESQSYASPPSREGHINCKTGSELKALMRDFFHNVFMFSMNDEVVHTGFQPMAHYLFALCTDRRQK